jgi:UDP-N-acetylglucosamine 2-epimerase (non-hydrolysing)
VKIVNIVGARPNFMKIAPLMRVMSATPGIQPLLVHTGQHYDHSMSKLFFDELHIPRPDLDLEVGSGSHAAQTAEIMRRFEPVVLREKPDLVLVVGDVNSTIACALVAVKLGVRVAHVEAGLRSFDRSMPEEINRILTDGISDFLFVSERSGLDNLKAEGVSDDKVFFVGNTMIDTLLANRESARRTNILAGLALTPKNYAVLTLHRPGNVDDPDTLARLLDVLESISVRLPIVFPVHPRTRSSFDRFGLATRVKAAKGLRLLDPLGYLEFLELVAESRFVLTDSGGIQEETTVLGVPCLTMRSNTERPSTIEEGTNVLVGNDPDMIGPAVEKVLAGKSRHGTIPPLWDGHAAERIVAILAR